MKKHTIILGISSLIFLSSCKSIQVIDLGKLNMISDRNIETKMDYVLIKNYAGGDKKEIKKALMRDKATTLDMAVDITVKNVAGGEFLKNVKVYGVKNKKKNEVYLFVEGDVWGLPESASFRGFKVGDIVQWKEVGITKKGVITGLTDAEKCMIKEEGKENSQPMKYSSIVKVNN